MSLLSSAVEGLQRSSKAFKYCLTVQALQSSILVQAVLLRQCAVSCCFAAAVLSEQGSMKPKALALHSSNWPGTERAAAHLAV